MPRSRPRFRKRRSAEEIEQIVSAFHASGETQRAFARSRRLSPATLSHWVRRAEKSGMGKPETAIVPVRVVDAKAVAGEPFEVVLANDRVIRVAPDFDAAALARLLAVVESRC